MMCMQEHVDLLRQLVCAFPARFQDLMRLTDPDPELDFFNNVAHLQLHRRSRAFYRLKKVVRPFQPILINVTQQT